MLKLLDPVSSSSACSKSLTTSMGLLSSTLNKPLTLVSNCDIALKICYLFMLVSV